MQSFWLKFEDGSEACCDGQSAYDAVFIAERISGKKVDLAGASKYKPEESKNVNTLPYPASPRIWAFEHPVHGATPAFCHDPKNCKGETGCRKSYACTN